MNALPIGASQVDATKKLTRRQLFVRGALATGGLLIGGTVFRFGWLLKQSPRAGLRVLSKREVEILEAVLLTFFPGAEGMPPADLEFMVPRIDAYLAQTDQDAAILFRSMLHVVEDHAVAFRLCRFTRCAPEVRAEEIRAWELTPVYLKRTAFMSLKVVTGSYYVEQPDARAAMGWYLGCQPAHLAPSHTGGAGV